MKRSLTFVIALFLTLLVWGQNIVQAHVQDAETGEALPYVRVYLGNGKGTLSNLDGDFTIFANEKDTIRISCVGYLTQRIQVAQISKTVNLTPSVKQMDELTVLPMAAIMDRAQKRLKMSLKDGHSKRNLYFCRIIEKLGDGTDMIEAFIDAKSMVHFRDMKMLSGRQTRVDESKQRPSLTSMNMHHLLEVGPMMSYNAFWNDLLVLPFNDKNYKDLYDWKYVTTKDENGNLLYVVKMLPNVRTGVGKMMEGTAYIDGSNYRLLRFTGTVPTMLMMYKERSTGQTTHVNTHITIDYSYDRDGMAEISNLSFETNGTNIRANGLMFRIDGKMLDGKRGKQIGENMISTIQGTGLDTLLWANSYFVQRTSQELIAAGGTNFAPHVEIKNPRLKKIYDNLMRAKWVQGQEKVFLHMDNTSYMIGDTLWFAAYTQNTNTNKPSDISGVLYVELLNQNGSLVERKIIEMKDGNGHGFFALPAEKTQSGFYELRAYTRWQLNWQDKLYSRVFPVYNGLPMQNRIPSEQEAINPVRSLNISFYPEGGHLISDVPNRVAFEARWSDGEAADGVLFFEGDTIRTQHQGRGCFLVKPLYGKDYYATFHTPDGKIRVNSKLPASERHGVTLHITHNGKNYSISTLISKDIEPGQLALSIRHNGILHEFIPFEEKMVDGNQFIYQYKPSSFEGGVYQATVFDDKGTIYADRLFFVIGDVITPSLSISGIQPKYNPFQKVEATIKLDNANKKEKRNISISFYDGERSQSTYDKSTILTEILLASELKGFIPNACWYFQSNDTEHQIALDLLMMTQGWRRFNWTGVAGSDSLETQQSSEEQITLMGHAIRTGGKAFKANRFESKKLQGYHADMDKEAYIYAILEDTSGKQKLPHIQTYDSGKFKLIVPKFYGNCILYLGATNVDQQKLASFKWNVKSDWEVFIDRPYPQFVTEYSFYQNHLPFVPFKSEKSTPETHRSFKSDDNKSLNDNRSILQGFSESAQFYSPDYSKQCLPETPDYRRTLYWNPNLQLDENGEAQVMFYNNSRTTQLSVEAEGQASDGTLLFLGGDTLTKKSKTRTILLHI